MLTLQETTAHVDSTSVGSSGSVNYSAVTVDALVLTTGGFGANKDMLRVRGQGSAGHVSYRHQTLPTNREGIHCAEPEPKKTHKTHCLYAYLQRFDF